MPPRPLHALLIFLCLPLLCTAQYRVRSAMGLLAGPQGAAWHSEAVDHRPVPGAALGVYVPIKAGPRVAVQPEFQLALGGTSFEMPEGRRTTLRTIHAYLPVGLKYFPANGFCLQLGGQAGYLLAAQRDADAAGDYLSPLDLGIYAGAGLATYSGLDFTLRYYNGLSNTLREDRAMFPTTRALQFTVGKRFHQFSYRRIRRR